MDSFAPLPAILGAIVGKINNITFIFKLFQFSEKVENVPFSGTYLVNIASMFY